MGEDTYKYRMIKFFKDETKGEHIQRMKRAERSGLYEPDDQPLKAMIAESLVVPGKVHGFVSMLRALGMRFMPKKGVGPDSFRIEAE